jgi:hypothetical protein
MRRVLSVLLLVAGCGPHAKLREGERGRVVSRDGVVSPPRFDTVAVRRLCVLPDSVLAGTRACELREQGVLFPRRF